MAVHNKLVRDNMQQIILEAGRKPITKILNQEDYINELRKKSNEELQEYLTAETNEEALEELADLLEVIHALAIIHDSSIEEVEKIRVKKAEKRGGFSDKVFLIEVTDA
jgi:predicted house-cleaning noncanonical NTP pyrophosphatase (MazG superfamily)